MITASWPGLTPRTSPASSPRLSSAPRRRSRRSRNRPKASPDSSDTGSRRKNLTQRFTLSSRDQWKVINRLISKKFQFFVFFNSNLTYVHWCDSNFWLFCLKYVYFVSNDRPNHVRGPVQHGPTWRAALQERNRVDRLGLRGSQHVRHG